MGLQVIKIRFQIPGDMRPLPANDYMLNIKRASLYLMTLLVTKETNTISAALSIPCKMMNVKKSYFI